MDGDNPCDFQTGWENGKMPSSKDWLISFASTGVRKNTESDQKY